MRAAAACCAPRRDGTVSTIIVRNIRPRPPVPLWIVLHPMAAIRVSAAMAAISAKVAIIRVPAMAGLIVRGKAAAGAPAVNGAAVMLAVAVTLAVAVVGMAA